jgi:hypothetical protein
MKNRISFVAVLAFTLGFAGCERGGSDNRTNEQAAAASAPTAETGSAANPEAAQAQPEASTPDQLLAAGSQPGPSAQPQPSQTPPKEITPPDFWDQKKGGVKDLPTFPKSLTTSMQMGPMGGAEVVILFGTVHGTFDEAVSYYDQQIKKNGWKSYFNTRDPGEVVWKMTKGQREEAAVQLKIDRETNTVHFGLSRTRRPAEAPSPVN